MTKTFASINLSIWQDNDWRALPPSAQHLYLILWTHPGLSYCGVVDWRPGRIAAMCAGLTGDDIQRAGACLEARLFIVTDADTEECLIRSWARFDGLLKQPRMAVSYANAFATVASADLRGVIVHETQKIRKLDPELAGWNKPQVASMLEMQGLNPRDRALPEDPFAPPFRGQFGDGFTHTPDIGLGETQPLPEGSVWGSPTPSPAPSSLLHSPSASANERDDSDRQAGEAATAAGERDADGFAEFWDTYPRKAARPTAHTAWRKATATTSAADILDGLRRVLPELAQRSSPRFIPEPARWLTEHRWEDETPTHDDIADDPWAHMPHDTGGDQ